MKTPAEKCAETSPARRAAKKLTSHARQIFVAGRGWCDIDKVELVIASEYAEIGAVSVMASAQLEAIIRALGAETFGEAMVKAGTKAETFKTAREAMEAALEYTDDVRNQSDAGLITGLKVSTQLRTALELMR